MSEVTESPNLRLLVTHPRSGSTLSMRILANHPDVAVTSRTVLMGNMTPRTDGEPRAFEPDYSLQTDPNHLLRKQARAQGKKFLVSKEEFGNDRHTGTKELNECNYDPFANTKVVDAVRPAFLVRDPVETFDSWLACGWSDVDSFKLVYQSLAKAYAAAKEQAPDTMAYTFESLTGEPTETERTLGSLCVYWGFEFDRSMLEFDTDFGSNFLYSSEREQAIYTHQRPTAIFDTVATSEGVRYDIKPHGLVGAREALSIRRELQPIYDELASDVLVGASQ